MAEWENTLSSPEPPNCFSTTNLYRLTFDIKNDDWIHLMRVLEISESEMEACCRRYPNLMEQKYQMLQIWLRKAQDGKRSHVDQLVEGLVDIGYEDLVSMFRSLSTKSSTSRNVQAEPQTLESDVQLRQQKLEGYPIPNGNLEPLTPPGTLVSDVQLRHPKMKRHPIPIGDHEPTPPGTLRNTEELDKMKSLLESNIEALEHIIVNVRQYSNRPTQAAECSERKKTLKDLNYQFQLKMDQLKQEVAALSSPEPPNCFSAKYLYRLILRIKDDDWIPLMRVLKISESEMEACCRRYHNLQEQKYQMLQIWLRKAQDGKKTHVDQLVKGLEVFGYVELASIFERKFSKSSKKRYTVQ